MELMPLLKKIPKISFSVHLYKQKQRGQSTTNQEECLQEIPNLLAPLSESLWNCDLISFFVVEATQFVVLCYGSPKRLIYLVNPVNFLFMLYIGFKS